MINYKQNADKSRHLSSSSYALCFVLGLIYTCKMTIRVEI